MLQAMELHPGRHHARVLEGGLLDLPVSHMVCLDLNIAFKFHAPKLLSD